MVGIPSDKRRKPEIYIGIQLFNEPSKFCYHLIRKKMMTCVLNLAPYNKHMLTSLDWSNTLPSEKLFSLCFVLKSVAYPSVKTMKYLEKLFNPLELTGFGKKKF